MHGDISILSMQCIEGPLTTLQKKSLLLIVIFYVKEINIYAFA